MVNPLQGWTPFGSTDASVVIQHRLNSLPAAADLGYTTRTILGGTSPTFDRRRGMKSWDGSQNTSLRFQTPNAAVQACATEGQFSIEIESNWLAASFTTFADSTGYVIPAVPGSQACLDIRNGGGTINLMRILKQTNNAVLISSFSNAGRANSMFIGGVPQAGVNEPVFHSAGKDEYVTLNGGWREGPTGSQFFFACDGLMVTRGLRSFAGSTGNYFDDLRIGSTDTAATACFEHYIRNFQVTNRCPAFPVSPIVGTISTISDSIFDFSSAFQFYGDSIINCQINRSFNQKGYRLGNYTSSENGGYSIVNGSAGALGWLGTVRAAVIATKPDTIIVCGGTNDMSTASYNRTTFINTYMTEFLEYFLARGAYTTNHQCRRVCICTVPPGVTQLTNVDIFKDINSAIRSLPTLWDTTYPSLAGRVQLFDFWKWMGNTIGTPPGRFADGAHFNGLGNAEMGRNAGEMLVALAA